MRTVIVLVLAVLFITVLGASQNSGDTVPWGKGRKQRTIPSYLHYVHKNTRSPFNKTTGRITRNSIRRTVASRRTVHAEDREDALSDRLARNMRMVTPKDIRQFKFLPVIRERNANAAHMYSDNEKSFFKKTVASRRTVQVEDRDESLSELVNLKNINIFDPSKIKMFPVIKERNSNAAQMYSDRGLNRRKLAKTLASRRTLQAEDNDEPLSELYTNSRTYEEAQNKRNTSAKNSNKRKASKRMPKKPKTSTKKVQEQQIVDDVRLGPVGTPKKRGGKSQVTTRTTDKRKPKQQTIRAPPSEEDVEEALADQIASIEHRLKKREPRKVFAKKPIRHNDLYISTGGDHPDKPLRPRVLSDRKKVNAGRVNAKNFRSPFVEESDRRPAILPGRINMKNKRIPFVEESDKMRARKISIKNPRSPFVEEADQSIGNFYFRNQRSPFDSQSDKTINPTKNYRVPFEEAQVQSDWNRQWNPTKNFRSPFDTYADQFVTKLVKRPLLREKGANQDVSLSDDIIVPRKSVYPMIREYYAQKEEALSDKSKHSKWKESKKDANKKIRNV